MVCIVVLSRFVIRIELKKKNKYIIYWLRYWKEIIKSSTQIWHSYPDCHISNIGIFRTLHKNEGGISSVFYYNFICYFSRSCKTLRSLHFSVCQWKWILQNSIQSHNKRKLTWFTAQKSWCQKTLTTVNFKEWRNYSQMISYHFII